MNPENIFIMKETDSTAPSRNPIFEKFICNLSCKYSPNKLNIIKVDIFIRKEIKPINFIVFGILENIFFI